MHVYCRALVLFLPKCDKIFNHLQTYFYHLISHIIKHLCHHDFYDCIFSCYIDVLKLIFSSPIVEQICYFLFFQMNIHAKMYLHTLMKFVDMEWLKQEILVFGEFFSFKVESSLDFSFVNFFIISFRSCLCTEHRYLLWLVFFIEFSPHTRHLLLFMQT